MGQPAGSIDLPPATYCRAGAFPTRNARKPWPCLVGSASQSRRCPRSPSRQRCPQSPHATQNIWEKRPVRTRKLPIKFARARSRV
uniref:Uncharacterized protein n=1 Tax=Setaria italica TaxID=4555 RepID=K3YFD2_SETIT